MTPCGGECEKKRLSFFITAESHFFYFYKILLLPSAIRVGYAPGFPFRLARRGVPAFVALHVLGVGNRHLGNRYHSQTNQRDDHNNTYRHYGNHPSFMRHIREI
jgi:hypothetical protein